MSQGHAYRHSQRTNIWIASGFLIESVSFFRVETLYAFVEGGGGGIAHGASISARQMLNICTGVTITHLTITCPRLPLETLLRRSAGLLERI